MSHAVRPSCDSDRQYLLLGYNYYTYKTKRRFLNDMVEICCSC